MKPAEIAALVRLKPPQIGAQARRLSTAHDIAGLRDAARRASPRLVFDYVEGGADDEVSMRANGEAFRRRRFIPRALVGVSDVDTTTEIFGQSAGMPLVLAPTGLTRMMHSAGEAAVAAAAARHRLPYTLSTLGTTSIADLASAPHGDLWFQLYIGRDRDRSIELVDEAGQYGYKTLVIAVDTAVSGRRVRDLRNGLTLPPALNLKGLAGIGIRPGYWLRMLRSPGLSFPNLHGGDASKKGLTGAAGWFDPGISWTDVDAIRARWPGRLLLKGPLGASDARRAVDAGVDGLQLSNHGGRQLDRTIAPIDLVPAVRAEVGPGITVIVDSGVRSGADIAVAIASGADAAGIGRAYLYGLMAGGHAGVEQSLTILAGEFRRTMQLLGVTSVASLREQGSDLLAQPE